MRRCLTDKVGIGRAVYAVSRLRQFYPCRADGIVGSGRKGEGALRFLPEGEPFRIVSIIRIECHEFDSPRAVWSRAFRTSDRSREGSHKFARPIEEPQLIVCFIDFYTRCSIADIAVSRLHHHNSCAGSSEVRAGIERLQQRLTHMKFLGEFLLGTAIAELPEFCLFSEITRQSSNERPFLVVGGDLVVLCD